MLKNMVSPKLPSNTKPTGSIFTVGNDVTTAPSNPPVTTPEGHTIIPTSTPLRKSNLSPTCADVIQMPDSLFWVKLMQRGYSRSIPGLYRFLRKQGILAVKPDNPKYVAKPYEQMQYPGQRIQIDVKFVPSICLVNEAKGQHFYQYTAIDEYSRWRFVEAFEEHSSYSSALFPAHLIKAFPFPVECVQTDNGQEFTKRFSPYGGSDKPAIFQVQLMKHGIKHKLIRPFTPRHNGKVERSHRKGNERFYAAHTFYSFEDLCRQLKLYNRRDYNNFPMRPLGWKTPNQVLRDYLQSV